jgi:hypothetical protein
MSTLSSPIAERHVIFFPLNFFKVASFSGSFNIYVISHSHDIVLHHALRETFVEEENFICK